MESEMLIAQQLLSDPRVAQATELLTTALVEHSANLRHCGPKAELSVPYQKWLEVFAELRGNSLFFPFLGSGAGQGALVELADGSVKYDMITGIGVHAMGHANPDLLAELIPAVLSDTIMQGNLQQNTESLLLSKQLVTLANRQGAALDHCFLSSSGAIANENAFKVLFQHRNGSSRILAFENAFAGRTHLTGQVTDRPKNREGQPLTVPVDYVPFFDEEHPTESTEATRKALNKYLQRYPDAHCGFIMELVQGEGGYYSAPREYFVAICQLLRKHEIPVFFDEIQTFGRTYAPFAFQMLELDAFADVVSVGKMSQVCATFFRKELNPKPGLLSQTFTSSTTAIIAARWILRKLAEGDFYGQKGRIAEIHSRFVSRFEAIHAKAPDRIRGPWGIGGMVAFTPMNGSAEAAKKVLYALYEAGVIAFVAGAGPARVRFLPPFLSLTNDEIENVCDILESVLLSLEVSP
ncbi:acetylornithine aminotransferase [Blastopirellula marina]|uniref:Acetylornithine aminotransferase n=1 Tax=Blastopirellula marina TaxID=124 RepID=A0A2S8F0U4_9BACT|nr:MULTISPECIES: aminotransferase class III-fold pyridoxal phosphate-dependent enzyme [Pirellulaceae]PQO25759.1 acetylornithine aminotransferase [Blastopirellula marina]RCS43442.1 aminotransferase class III-fold pyridoxal phosphate-dependent enzyme [Bremerella cremea]